MTYIFFPGDQLSIIHLLFHKPGFQKKSHFLKVMQDLLQRKRTCMHCYLRKPSLVFLQNPSFCLANEIQKCEGTTEKQNLREVHRRGCVQSGFSQAESQALGFPVAGRARVAPPTALPGGTCLAAEL